MLFLKANDLKKSYGNREVLSVDSLHLYNHDRVDLVGRNGEGKPTLLSILAGMREPDTGLLKAMEQSAISRKLKKMNKK
ncbi:ATP-binding cassette domain-containing protein [Peribacillus simplex]|uniref:ATP-binding cassette domain-containing protein n=1 Tax=Peribacillus simplex TaxID=1478 RepID=UPI00339B6C78